MRHNKNIMLICIWGIMVILFSIVLFERMAIQLYGLEYFMNNSKYCFEVKPYQSTENCNLVLDFKNPQSSIGKIIYEEGDNTITVTEVIEKSEYDIIVYLESTGSYDYLRGEGRFISPSIAVLNEDKIWQLSNGKYDIDPDDVFRCRVRSKTSEYDGLSNKFSITMSKIDTSIPLQKNEQIVKVNFNELGELNWHRNFLE